MDKCEDWLLPDAKFYTVVYAVAFHWLDPGIRLPKLAKTPRGKGTLESHAATMQDQAQRASSMTHSRTN